MNEIARIKKAVKTREVYEPIIEKGKSKLDDLHILLEKGRDVCTTHALFKLFNSETHRLLIRKGYTLILDEVLNVIEQIRIRRNSLDLLLEADAIYIEDYKGKQLVRWNQQKKII